MAVGSPPRGPFRRILAANTVSTLGSQVSFVAVPLLAGLRAGVSVDRSDPQQVMLTSRALAALITGATTIAVIADWEVRTLLVALVAIEGAAAVYFAPAEDVLIRDVVPAPRLPTAISWSEAAVWAAGLAGPLLGTVLIDWDTAVPFFFNCASYALAFLLLLKSFPSRDSTSTVKPVADRRLSDNLLGFRLLRADSFMRFVILQVPIHNIVLGALTIYTIVRLEDQGESRVLVGMVISAQAAGALVGTSFSAAAVHRAGPGRLLLLNGAVWCCLVPLIAVLDRPVAIAAGYFFLWLFAPSQRTGIVTYQATAMPAEHLGKIRSSSGVLVQIASAIGPLLGAVLVEGTAGAAAAFLAVIVAVPVAISASQAGVRAAFLPSSATS